MTLQYFIGLLLFTENDVDKFRYVGHNDVAVSPGGVSSLLGLDGGTSFPGHQPVGECWVRVGELLVTLGCDVCWRLWSGGRIVSGNGGIIIFESSVDS